MAIVKRRRFEIPKVFLKEMERRPFIIGRHGITAENIRGLVAGAEIDPSLAPLGEEKTATAGAALRAALASRKMKVGRIFASPMNRATETARFYAAALQTGTDVTPMDEICERFMGGYSRMPYAKYKRIQGFLDRMNPFKNLGFGPISQLWYRLEPEHELARRALGGINIELVKLGGHGDVPMFITHSAVTKTTIKRLTGTAPDSVDNNALFLMTPTPNGGWRAEVLVPGYKAEDIAKAAVPR